MKKILFAISFLLLAIGRAPAPVVSSGATTNNPPHLDVGTQLEPSATISTGGAGITAIQGSSLEKIVWNDNLQLGFGGIQIFTPLFLNDGGIGDGGGFTNLNILSATNLFTAHKFLGGPVSGSPAIPTARSLDGSDLPITAGSGITLSTNSGNLSIATTGGGTVTSVGLSAPAEFSVSGSPVTTSGTLSFTKANQNALTVWAGPASGAAAAPAFRTLNAADIPAQAKLYAAGLVYDDFSQYTGASPTINGGYNWSGQTAVLSGTTAIVTNTTDSSGAQNALAITNNATNGEFIRTMPWGAKWKKLRIGVLYRIQTNATFTCEFALGLCSGTANGWGSSSCANAIALDTAPGNNNAFTFNAGTDYAYFTATFSSFGTKHNTTITDLTPTGSGGIRPAGVATARGAIVVQISRAQLGSSSNNYVTSLWSTADLSTTADQSDYDASTLLADLLSQNAGILIPGTASLTKTSSFSESNGALDSVDIFWGGQTAAIEIDCIGVARFY